MTISFASAVGNLYNRLGKLGALIKNLNSYQATQLVSMTNTTTGVVAQFNAESDIQALMGDSYIGILASSGSNVGSTAQAIARATINRAVYRDNPRLNQTLTSDNTLASLQEVIRQMKLAGATVLAMTITATPTQFSTIATNIGNGVINYSVKRALDGAVMENTFSETTQLLCTSDSYSGSATAGNEGITITGQGNQSDLFAFNWPLGSNCQTSLNAIDGNTSNGSGNLLTNSGFETWVANIPNNFSLVSGTAGINILQETTLNYDGVASLRLVGDVGGTLVQITQAFNSSTGTGGTLSPLTQYSFNIWGRRGGAAGTGQWVVDLIDGNGNVIADQSGVANTTTISFASLTTSYQPFSAIFRTPKIMPAVQYLRMRMPTGQPASNGFNAYFDKASLGLTSQLYTGGPALAVHAGSVPFAIGDYGYCAFSNSRGAANTLNTWQTLAFRLFTEVQGNELLLPSSATPSIDDGSLIS